MGTQTAAVGRVLDPAHTRSAVYPVRRPVLAGRHTDARRVGAGLFGALFPLVVKDLTQGTGRFNVSLGALTTVFGLGAALSNSLAGFVVQGAGYSVAFLTLATIAGGAFVLLWVAMPETLRAGSSTHINPPLICSPNLDQD